MVVIAGFDVIQYYDCEGVMVTIIRRKNREKQVFLTG
jgi:hypothetical protein